MSDYINHADHRAAGELAMCAVMPDVPSRPQFRALLDEGLEPSAATVIVRADGRAQTGEVQDIIRICQEKGFERFALRAQYDDRR